jgi:hypothetical protein
MNPMNIHRHNTDQRRRRSAKIHKNNTNRIGKQRFNGRRFNELQTAVIGETEEQIVAPVMVKPPPTLFWWEKPKPKQSKIKQKNMTYQ